MVSVSWTKSSPVLRYSVPTVSQNKKSESSLLVQIFIHGAWRFVFITSKTVKSMLVTIWKKVFCSWIIALSHGVIEFFTSVEFSVEINRRQLFWYCIYCIYVYTHPLYICLHTSIVYMFTHIHCIYVYTHLHIIWLESEVRCVDYQLTL